MQVLKVLRKYGPVGKKNNSYELILNITPTLLGIPCEYEKLFPIYQDEWCIIVSFSKDTFHIETSDQVSRLFSKTDQEEAKAALSRIARKAIVACDGFKISKEEKYTDASFKESIGRITSAIKKYCFFHGDMILGYTIYHQIKCFCGFQLEYSKFKLRCRKKNCRFQVSLAQISEAIKNLRVIPDLDCEGIARDGKIGYYLQRGTAENQYRIVRMSDTARKNWMRGLRKKEDSMRLINPTLSYPGIVFHPLQRGNEERVPVFLSWVDLSGGARVLKKRDILDGRAILLKLDRRKSTLQAFKPGRMPHENRLGLGDYRVPVEIPKNVYARIDFYDKLKRTGDNS